MPISMTPAANEPAPPNCTASPTQLAPTPLLCEELDVVKARVSTMRRRELLTRMQTITVRAGQAAKLEWQLRAHDGRPVDLTTCGFTSESSASVGEGASVRQIVLRIREAVTHSAGVTEHVATEVDAATGKVIFQLARQDVCNPGIFFAEVAIVDLDEAGTNVVHSNVFYLHVDRGTHAMSAKGPPTLAEIRLHLRDSATEENVLLDTYKFDDAEIAASIIRPVDYWNELPPNLGRATTMNFARILGGRFHWLEAICGNLMLIAAEHFRANQLEYQAGGITVNDMGKERNYEEAAARRLNEWKIFVRSKKSELNLNGGYGGIGSDYAY